MKIKQEVIAATYLAAKNANSGMLSQAEAVDTVVKAYKMEKSTITGYIRNFNHMINGERYRRTLNLSATEFFIENIFKDYGYIKLQNALSSLNQHIIYYESIINVNRKAFRDLLIKYGKITNPNVQNYPDEMDNTYQVLTEGTLQKVFVNRFERNRKARQQCINH